MPDLPHDDSDHTLVSGYPGGKSARKFEPGDIIGGSYKIKSLLGRGGMGVVYRAEHLTVGRDLAIKILAPDRVNEANWQRFETEGKAISRLEHRNIVKVYDMGVDGADCLYYAMDLLQGVSLAQHLRKNGSLELNEVLQIFGQICSGLGYAHSRGLIHRDVKPSNIILCAGASGSKVTVKIIDFGLVKLTGVTGRDVQSQTAVGVVFGSPLYMSPEQCLGIKVDQRSDIYSLGCSLFECLTGEPPFPGKNFVETSFMQQNKPPPRLSDVRPEGHFSASLEMLVERMLQKDPARRHRSMEEVAHDLMRIQAGKSIIQEASHSPGPAKSAGELAGAITEEHPAATAQAGISRLVLISATVGAALLLLVISLFYVSSLKPPTVIATGETLDASRAEEIFRSWAPISQGVTDANGLIERVFSFPEVPVGMLFWGENRAFHKVAQGKVIVSGGDAVTLQIPRALGAYTRLFPAILSKIGPDDIDCLEVTEEDDLLDGGASPYHIPVSMIEAIQGWRSLHHLNIFNCRIHSESIIALNKLSSITALQLRDSTVDGNDLAKVKWLPRLTSLDIRNIQNVDSVIAVLKNTPGLLSICLDRTSPSATSLKILASCPNLESVSLSEGEIDDKKLPVLCQMTQLKKLNLKSCLFTSKSVHCLANLRALRILNLDKVRLREEDVLLLKRALPRCKIYFEVIRSHPMYQF